MVNFAESLEKKARQIVKDYDGSDWDNSIPSILKREIALTVSQIDQLRKFNGNQISKLNRTESDIGTELLQMEDRTPRYSPHRYPEREKFQRQLVGLKGERRRQDILYEDKLQNLHKVLLNLIHKYEQINNINDGHQQNPPKARTFNAGTG